MINEKEIKDLFIDLIHQGYTIHLNEYHADWPRHKDVRNYLNIKTWKNRKAPEFKYEISIGKGEPIAYSKRIDVSVGSEIHENILFAISYIENELHDKFVVCEFDEILSALGQMKHSYYYSLSDESITDNHFIHLYFN